MTSAADVPGFRRRIGLFDATMLVAGGMIGSGVFIVSASIARDVGGAGWLLVVWLIAGLMTVLGALAYAELAAMMPRAGGQYVFLREAYSPLWGFLYGWTSFTVIQTGTIAAVAVAFAKFLGVFVPQLGTGDAARLGGFQLGDWAFTITAGQLVAVALLVGLTAWNTRGVEAGKRVQNVLTVAKIGALAGVIAVGFALADPAVIHSNWETAWAGADRTKPYTELQSSLPSSFPASAVVWMVLGGALVGALFSSDAWNNVTFTGGEMTNPRRDLPLSLVLGTGLVTVLYILANLAYLAVLPAGGAAGADSPAGRGVAHAADDRVATAVMEVALPSVGAAVMAALVMVSTAGCVNGMVLAGARLYYAMAADGLFFRRVGTLNAAGVPQVGLWAQCAWACLLVFSGRYGDLLDYVIFAALAFYALTVAGLFVLRARRPDLDRPYKALGYPWLPGLYVALCVLVMLDLLVVKPLYTWPGLVIVLAGVPVYFLWRRGAPAGGRDTGGRAPTATETA